MEFKYKDKIYEAKFNIGFVRRLDEKQQVELFGQPIGISIQGAMSDLNNRDLIMLVDVLHAAMPQLKEAEIEQIIEAYAEEHGDLDMLFKEVIEEMGESAVLKSSIKKEKEETKNELTEEMIMKMLKR